MKHTHKHAGACLHVQPFSSVAWVVANVGIKYNMNDDLSTVARFGFSSV